MLFFFDPHTILTASNRKDKKGVPGETLQLLTAWSPWIKSNPAEIFRPHETVEPNRFTLALMQTMCAEPVDKMACTIMTEQKHKVKLDWCACFCLSGYHKAFLGSLFIYSNEILWARQSPRQYLVHEFPAFLHHFLIDHCRLVGLGWLLVRLKGVLHQADETGAPPRISGH